MREKKIGFVGTDGRSLLGAYTTSMTGNQIYHGIMVRGTDAMEPWTKKLGWPVDFIPTKDNSVKAYAEALVRAFREERLDVALVMPEGLLFEGLVDIVVKAGFGDRIIGPDSNGAFLEDDKIACKNLCVQAGIPVAPSWMKPDARDYPAVLKYCLWFIHRFGGAVLKYPYSAGGKGARIILNAWEIREVYDGLMEDYAKHYATLCGEKNPWPLLIEARMSGVEISFTILVDKHGYYRALPTAMDYPERFEGRPSGVDNPITGGMGAVSPHPFESEALLKLAEKTIAGPLVEAMKTKGILRPCVLYPGCFVSFKDDFQPTSIRVCEINIRPGEPEFQPVIKRLRNLGALLEATAKGTLDRVWPEVREDQLSMCVALVTGPGGPKGQKGYPWSLTKGEVVEIDWDYFEKKKITVIPSAMDYVDGKFKSDGSRVAYLVANATVKPGETRNQTAEALRQKLYGAFDAGKIRVVPRENNDGNRLACREDIGLHYTKVEALKAGT